MKAAAEIFAADLDGVQWRAPKFPVYHNVGNAPATLEEIPQRLLQQLYSPVNWTGAVPAVRHHAELAVEFGPGKVIAGLNKRIDKSLPVAGTGDLAGLEASMSKIQGAE